MVSVCQGYSGQTGGVDGTHRIHDSNLDSFAGQHYNAHDCRLLSISVHSLLSFHLSIEIERFIVAIGHRRDHRFNTPPQHGLIFPGKGP